MPKYRNTDKRQFLHVLSQYHEAQTQIGTQHGNLVYLALSLQLHQLRGLVPRSYRKLLHQGHA